MIVVVLLVAIALAVTADCVFTVAKGAGAPDPGGAARGLVVAVRAGVPGLRAKCVIAPRRAPPPARAAAPTQKRSLALAGAGREAITRRHKAAAARRGSPSQFAVSSVAGQLCKATN